MFNMSVTKLDLHTMQDQGNNWNKKVVDITFEGLEKDIEVLRLNNQIIKELIGKAIKSTISGVLVRNIYYFVIDNDFEIELPEQCGESFETLSRYIYDALGNQMRSLSEHEDSGLHIVSYDRLVDNVKRLHNGF